MKFTVQEALTELAPFVGLAGTTFCPNDPESIATTLKRLNEVRRMIYSEGAPNYIGTVGWMSISINQLSPDCSCFRNEGQVRMTLPVQVESIISAASIDGDVGFVSRNHTLIDRDVAMRYGRWDSNVNTLLLQESSSKPAIAFTPPERFNFYIRSQHEDDKSVITFKIRRGINFYFERITLNGESFVRCESGADEIVEVSKPVTKGIISVYIESERINPNKGVIPVCSTGPGLEVARYPAAMTNPRYLEIVAATDCSRRVDFDNHNSIMLYYRKKFVQLTELDELVDIESMEALQFASKAKNYQQSDVTQYAQSLQLMRDHLERVEFAFTLSSVSEEFNMHRDYIDEVVYPSPSLLPIIRP